MKRYDPATYYISGDHGAVMGEMSDGDYYEVEEVDRELARLRAEVEKLRADVVWAVSQRANYRHVGNRLEWMTGYRKHEIACDSADASLLSAVRRAREGNDGLA